MIEYFLKKIREDTRDTWRQKKEDTFQYPLRSSGDRI